LGRKKSRQSVNINNQKGTGTEKEQRREKNRQSKVGRKINGRNLAKSIQEGVKIRSLGKLQIRRDFGVSVAEEVVPFAQALTEGKGQFGRRQNFFVWGEGGFTDTLALSKQNGGEISRDGGRQKKINFLRGGPGPPTRPCEKIHKTRSP